MSEWEPEAKKTRQKTYLLSNESAGAESSECGEFTSVRPRSGLGRVIGHAKYGGAGSYSEAAFYRPGDVIVSRRTGIR